MDLKNPIKKEIFILSGICILFFVFWIFLFFYTTHQWCQDSHWIMSSTESFAKGKGYSFPDGSPQSLIPIGMPLLILPFYLILGNIHLAGLILVGILSFFSIILTYFVGKQFSKEVGLAASFLLATHNLFIFYSVSVMTEIPFIFFSLLGLFLFIKGFQKTRYFIFALPLLAYAVLIRYSGVVLIVPMIYYLYKKFKRFKEIYLSDNFLIGFFIGSSILLSWLIRNFFAFGNPFYNSYSNAVQIHIFQSFWNFFKNFFNIEPLFAVFSLIGLFFIFKKGGDFGRTLIFWFVSFFILHSYWWGGQVLRFYAQILPILSIFCVFGFLSILSKFCKNKKYHNFFLIFFLIVLSSIQIFIFFSGAINQETTIQTMNRYKPIQEIMEWSDNNLKGNVIYIVSDLPSYTLYSSRSEIYNYPSGIREMLSNQNNRYYIFADNLHPWMTEPFLEGEKGKITLRIGPGNYILMNTSLIKKTSYKNYYAIVLSVDSVEVR